MCIAQLMCQASISSYVTMQGDTPLMCAASDGHAEVIKQLLLYGADTAASNKVVPEQLP